MLYALLGLVQTTRFTRGCDLFHKFGAEQIYLKAKEENIKLVQMLRLSDLFCYNKCIN